MCRVALDCAAQLAIRRGDSELAASWAQNASQAKSDILERGLDERGVLRQHYETDPLDVSTLLAAIFGFLPGSEPRLRAIVLPIADELSENGFVLRYRTEHTGNYFRHLLLLAWKLSAGLLAPSRSWRLLHASWLPRA